MSSFESAAPITENGIEGFDASYETGMDHSYAFKYGVLGGTPIPTIAFSSDDLNGQIVYDPTEGIYNISGHFTDEHLKMGEVRYFAASPPTRGYSLAGSGLPYANPGQAYGGTPNRGIAQTHSDGSFTFKVWEPSAFYVNQGSVLLRPHVHVYGKDTSSGRPGKVHSIELNKPSENRSLTSLPGRPSRREPR